jgi:hypothetical protein
MVSEPDVSAVPVDGQAAEPGPLVWPGRLALLVIAALAGLSYAWAMKSDPLEIYYAAAVRSMSMSWHNFFYGAFDPAASAGSPGRSRRPRWASSRATSGRAASTWC